MIDGIAMQHPRATWRHRFCGDRSRRVTVLLLGIIILSAADLITTLAYLRTTGMAEANPIAAWLIRTTGSPWMLALYKATTVAISVSLLFWLRRRRFCEFAAWCGLAILVGVVFMWGAYSKHANEPSVIHLATVTDLYGDSWLMLD